MAIKDSPIAAYQRWLGLAERSRRIATYLLGDDARVAEAYARECEAEARRVIERAMSKSLAA
jgi:hypothetical protein